MRVYIGFLDVPLTTISALEDAQIGQSAESRRSATELHRPNWQWPIAANFSTVCLMEEGMRHFFVRATQLEQNNGKPKLIDASLSEAVGRPSRK